MNCPPELADILLGILNHTLLMIRCYSDNRDAKTCSDLAYHAHNLPGLIRNFDPQSLAIYWTSSRVRFRKDDPDNAEGFDELWRELEPLVERLADPGMLEAYRRETLGPESGA